MHPDLVAAAHGARDGSECARVGLCAKVKREAAASPLTAPMPTAHALEVDARLLERLHHVNDRDLFGHMPFCVQKGFANHSREDSECTGPRDFVGAWGKAGIDAIPLKTKSSTF